MQEEYKAKRALANKEEKRVEEIEVDREDE